jgi:2,3-bisphosphoglycerate-dependent phosphoglycerate mutase
MEEKIGVEEFEKLRRGWDYPVPNGETLKMVYDRAVPYYKEKIVPKVAEGNNVLVVSHGNTLRALIKYIENLSDEEVVNVEMPFGAMYVYDIDTQGHKISKEERIINTEKK